ncbi:MAG: hypothetical protein CBC96_04145 [Pelagibacteraceae bacterium TMED136]|nr:MAG: hypothetical protein CBC96_04145 [Pelagibacteraceae bacterium TMED136]|tara:strand:- start:23103 stop:23495 length:393 start_codon:yes stop_codon:yes gene_type:complete
MNEKKIIQIAANTNFYGIKNMYPLKTRAKNKLCGDEIIIEIEENFKNIRFESRSCVFTQASAAILAKNFSEMYRYGLKNILTYIKKKLNGDKVNIPFKSKELELLICKENKNRKECITLPFEAIINIIND